MKKRVLMIAGPNGAGKTTAAMTLLPKFLGIHEFVNADEIARGLNPLDVEGQALAAGRMMIHRIGELTRQKKNFGFETTAAGTHHLSTLKSCQQAGYETMLAFLWLPNAAMAIRRVKYRVKSGGHSIKSDVIRRRYKKGLYHLVKHYLPLVDRAIIYDNSNTLTLSKLPIIAEKLPGKSDVMVHDNAIWQKILEVTHGKKNHI